MSQHIIVTAPGFQKLIVNPASPSELIVKTQTNHVSVIGSGQPGPPGIQGPPGVAVGYDYIQSSPSSTWIINHNLGFRPSVQVFNTGGLEVLGEIQHVSNNQTTITFNVVVAGTARLN